MINALVVDYDIGPPVPAIMDKLLSLGVTSKGIRIETLMKEVSTRHNSYDLLMIHCNAYNKLDGAFYKPSGRFMERIREWQEGIVTIGYSPISPKILNKEYGSLYDDCLSLSGDLYGRLERTLKKHKV
ncbi:hypothetical protein HYV89_00525, partial [Candidatus Woesearchaeota archaeon]|nr:hypothetical protein [Candidatus Woesearchaeota archaeon]